MRCPFKFGNYDFEGAEDCIGAECGMFKRCNAETEITAVEFDALDDYAQALERENAELKARVDELEDKLQSIDQVVSYVMNGATFTAKSVNGKTLKLALVDTEGNVIS